MILLEITYDQRNKDLDYLAEYIIESKGVTIKEAKELIRLIEDEKQTLVAKIKASAMKQIEKLKAWKDTAIAAARKKYKDSKVLKAAIDNIKKKYNKQLDLVKAQMQKAGKNIFSRSGRLKATVKAAVKTFPKTGKVAGGVAAAGAITGGIAAYSANKKRKAALAAANK